MKKLLLLLCLFAAPVSAQPRPGAFTTLTTTSTITDGGLLNVNGFGTSVFSAGGTGAEQVNIINTVAGTGNYAALAIGTNISSTQMLIAALSSTFTGAGDSMPSGGVVRATQIGGLSISATDPSGGIIRFYTGGTTERARLFTSGGLSVGNTVDPGSGIVNGVNAVYAAWNNAGAYAALTGTSLQFFAGPSFPLSPLMDSTGFKSTTWPTTASAANAVVADGDYLRRSTSIRANKHDIAPIALDEARRTVLGLQAVLYQSNVDVDQRQWAGFIADDVAKVNPILAVFGAKGELQSVTYDRVPAYLLPVVQDHDARIMALEQALKALAR